MTAYTIDTLEATEELQQAGFTTEQAKAMTKLVKHQGEQLATKSDIAGLRWTFGILFGFQSALTLLILARVFDFIGAPGQ